MPHRKLTNGYIMDRTKEIALIDLNIEQCTALNPVMHITVDTHVQNRFETFREGCNAQNF